MALYKILPGGVTVPLHVTKPMEKSEFDRILRDEGIRNANVRDALWKEAAPRAAQLSEPVVRNAVRMAIRKDPSIKARHF